jgi:hypothetical protein
MIPLMIVGVAIATAPVIYAIVLQERDGGCAADPPATAALDSRAQSTTAADLIPQVHTPSRALSRGLWLATLLGGPPRRSISRWKRARDPRTCRTTSVTTQLVA